MLFRSFLRRLRVKYTVLDFHPLVLFYSTSMVLVPGRTDPGPAVDSATAVRGGHVVTAGAVRCHHGAGGVQSLFTAMAMDWQADRHNRAGERRNR